MAKKPTEPHADAPPGRRLGLNIAVTLLDLDQGAALDQIVTRHAQALLDELAAMGDRVTDVRGTWAGLIRADLKPKS